MTEIETYGTNTLDAPKRTTHFINRKPAANLFHAVNVAEILGRSLNHLITLNFEKTNSPPDEASIRFEKLRDNYFGPWLRRAAGKGRPKCPPTFVWSMENVGGCIHAHWLVHIPSGRLKDFKRRLPAWLAKAVGEVNDEKGAIHIRKALTPRGAIKYMLKGIDPFYAALYGIRESDQGKVMGNRCNFSRSLGPSIKKKLQEEGRMKPTKKLFAPGKIPAAPPPTATH